jgi:hypothetical protein
MLTQKQNKNPKDWCNGSSGRVLDNVKGPEFNTVYTKKKKKSLKKTSCLQVLPEISKTIRIRLLKESPSPTLTITTLLQGLSVHYI